MKIIQGDIFQLIKSEKYDILVHGCNCFCNMGAGFALYLKKHYPIVLETDRETIVGDSDKLGTYTYCEVTVDQRKMIVVNAYTQYHWRGKGVLADYNAIAKVFSSIARDFHGKKIIYPKIGAGLANGDWGKIEMIIKKELNGEDHYCVEYKKGAN